MGRIIIGCGVALIAIAMAIAGAISIYAPLLATCSLNDRHALALSFYDGRVRLFYFQSDVEPIQAVPVFARFPAGMSPEYPILGAPITPSIRAERLPLPDVIPIDNNARNNRRREPFDVRLGDRRGVPDFGGKWREDMSYRFFPVPTRPPAGKFSYFRLPVWLPVSLMILFPVRSMIVGPWRERRRRKKNQCVSCGYSLYRLTEPRCPECGFACALAVPDKVTSPRYTSG